MEAPLDPASYRHVVFANSFASLRHPLNFAIAPFVHRPRAAEPLTTHERAFLIWLFERAALRASRYRQQTLARRLPACLRALRCVSVSDARDAIEANPHLLPEAVDALLIGVTSFFREWQVFDALRSFVLPSLSEACHATRRPLRVWSVGCSDGKELYSVTMLLAEMDWLNRADLLGTDCRATPLRRAAQGAYDAADLASVPPDLRRRYFSPVQTRWRIDSRLRSVVRWRTADVLQITEPGEWDLILCRNLAMYLEPAAASLLWQQLHRCLRPGAVLLVGKAERPGIQGLLPVAPCIFRRDRD